MRVVLVLAATLVASEAVGQTVQTITREQSHILLDIQGYERATEAYRYVQPADYSSEIHVVARALPRDAAFGMARVWELAPNFTFRPGRGDIDANWVHSHWPKLKERQLAFEAPLIATEKLKLTRFAADPAACVAFEATVGDIGVRSDSSTGTRHAVVSGVACSQTVKRLSDEEIARSLAGVQVVSRRGGKPEPAFNVEEIRALMKR